MFSIVEYYFNPDPQKYWCGYCKQENAYKRYGMRAHRLTVKDYQNLIDRGWRRSGSYCYKPMNEHACCPMYTIKCEALHFTVSKSQKKIIKKVAKFLKDGKIDDENDRKTSKINYVTPYDIDMCNIVQPDPVEYVALEQTESFVESDEMIVENECDSRLIQPQLLENNLSSNINNERENTQSKPLMEDIKQKNIESTSSKSSDNIRNKKVKINCISGSDDALPRKAKLIRIERARNRLLAQGKTLEEIESIYKKKKEKNKSKTIDELLDSVKDGKNKLELKLVRVSSEEFMYTLDESVELYKKYQTAVHNDLPCECDKKSFLNFLGKTPLQHLNIESGPPHGYGSFHQQYWLNNKLIAIGVIDILPYCVSSVYFLYDPAYSFLSLGTYSSLVEVRLTCELNKLAPDLKYYYMGYYIHLIPKMRYKAKMRPSKLLCPVTYKWFDIDHCIKKLDVNKYSRFNDDLDAIDEDGIIDEEALMQVRVYYCGRRLYRNVCDIRRTFNNKKDDSNEVQEYAEIVGKKCAHSMYLNRC